MHPPDQVAVHLIHPREICIHFGTSIGHAEIRLPGSLDLARDEPQPRIGESFTVAERGIGSFERQGRHLPRTVLCKPEEQGRCLLIIEGFSDGVEPFHEVGE